MSAADTALTRWLKFNLVGGIGIVLQLSLVQLLGAVCHLPYLAATAIAVEATVLHNFLWHERYTWRGRRAALGSRRSVRLLRFHLGNGAVSLAGNLIFMKLLVGGLHLPLLAGNALSIVLCSLINFGLADRWVFE